MPDRVADQLARSLLAAGVSRVFSLSGNQIMSLYDALFEVGINIVHVRHEAAAVHMADGWARATGETGVALVTAGPGHANALSALFTARGCDSPIVLLSGHAPVSRAGQCAFQTLDQAAMAAPVCKAAWTPTTAATLAGALARALQLANDGRKGPVQLSLPVDLLEGAAATQASAAENAAPEVTNDASQLTRLLDALEQAQKPVVIAGPAAMRGETWRGLQQLRQHQIPVIGCESPRGLRDPSLGAFAEVLPQADLIVLVDKLLDFTLGFAEAPHWGTHTKIAAVNVDLESARQIAGASQGRQLISIRLTAKAAAGGVCSALATATPRAPDWADAVAEACNFRPKAWKVLEKITPGPMHPVSLFARVAAHMAKIHDWTLVADGGEVGQWAQACLHAPRRIINGVPGAIGAGVPLAIGAQLARDVPTIAIVGDGTFGFHLAEMDTAVRAGAAIIVLVCNDARWNAEHQIQLRDYGANRLVGCELQDTRYDQVVAPFGVHAEHVGSGLEFDASFDRALKSGTPACMNIALDGQPAPTFSRD